MATRTADIGGGLTATWDDAVESNLVITYDGVGTGVMVDYADPGEGNNPPWQDSWQLVKNVIFPSGIKNIGNDAFYGMDFSSSSEILFPNTITSIGSKAFYNAGLPDFINLPDTITSIGEGAFANSGVYEIHLPAALTSLGVAAFHGSALMDFPQIPDGITAIPPYCFALTQLKYVSIPTHVAFIDYDAFYNIPSLLEVVDYGSVELSNSAFKQCTSLKTYSVPNNTLKIIGTTAFESCTALEAIPDSQALQHIGQAAFRLCTSMTTLDLPASVNLINPYAFLECTSVRKIISRGTSAIDTMGQDCFAVNRSLPSVTVDFVSTWGSTITVPSTTYGDYVVMNFKQPGGKVRVRVNGVWKEATPYVRYGGVWKQAKPYVRVNNTWKDVV